MPFKAPPTTFTCTHCGWKKTVIPRSDVLELPPFCPHCGEAFPSHRHANGIEILGAKVKDAFKPR